MSDSNASSGSVPAHIYLMALKRGWADGTLTKDEEALLTTLRKALDISDEQHDDLQKEAYLDIYLEAIVGAWEDGILQAEDSEKSEELRERFHISAQDHLKIERQVREFV